MVGFIQGQTPGGEAETEGEVSGEVFHVAAEAGMVVDLDGVGYSWIPKGAGSASKTVICIPVEQPICEICFF